MENKLKYINDLEEFKSLLKTWDSGEGSSDTRSQINKKLRNARNLVLQAGALKTFTISPPPMIGGMIIKNFDSFTTIFNPHYNRSLIPDLIDMIDEAIGVIETKEDFDPNPKISIQKKGKGGNVSNRIFLVHGHDNELKETTARFLEKVGLKPIILHEQTSKGLTIIEKFEEYSDDLVTASTWLVKLNSPYSAKLTYIFYLPQKEHEDYKKEMQLIESDDIKNYWLTIKYQFLRKYASKIYGGNPEYKNVVDTETIKKIDFQFLDAIRDVNRDLFTGRNTLLREVIDFFIDYDIKSNSGIEKKEQQKQIAKKRKDFSEEAKKLIQQLQTRMASGKKEMLSYASDTGASFEKSKPDFEGHILDTELYSALKLIVKHETGMTIPATHNGLGYNNLIYISLLLAKMQKDASGDYLGSNSKTFPILAIEEPEAHLHPAMQYKFLKFLYENNKEKVKQIFITTHSPNITAAANLDNIICFNRYDKGLLNVAYLGKAFSEDEKDSKAYVRRFLDATKSDMLFSKKVVLVEGITEQLLIPVFANYEDKRIEDEHISVINIGGRYFKHFLKLFDSEKPNTINKKVACITDLDPVYTIDDDTKNEKCYPFEKRDDLVEFKECSNSLVDDYAEAKHPNIRSFSQQKGIGKTFEYAIAFENLQTEIYIGETIANKEELKNLIKAYNDGKTLDELLSIFSSRGAENNRIKKAIKESDLDVEERKKHLIASRYLNSLSKGENAYELAQILQSNLEKDNPVNFKTPVYIKQAIDWICE